MFLKHNKAASTTELGLLAGLIAVLIIGVIASTGSQLSELFTIGANNIEAVTEGRVVTPTEPEGPVCAPNQAEASCQAHLDNGCTSSRSYKLRVNGSEEDFMCDMETNGGGWIVIVKELAGSSAIDTALYNDRPLNVTSPMSSSYRASKATMTALQTSTSEMRIDCRGTDHLETSASNLFNGAGGTNDCNNHSVVTYSSASLKGYALTNVQMCTWYTSHSEGCAGAFHIDEYAQTGYCGDSSPNYPWNSGSPITTSSADTMAVMGAYKDPTTDCHKSGATRYIMLR